MKLPIVEGSSPEYTRVALDEAAMTCCWLRKWRQPKIRCSLRLLKVVRHSAGPGVYAGGTGGRAVMSSWRLVRSQLDNGVLDVAMSSSSLSLIVS